MRLFDAKRQNLRKEKTKMLFETIKFYLGRSGKDEKGVTTVEYAIMLALVAIAVALATPGISDAVTSVFDEAATAMTS
jgi:Flp pilus assembly pilin Flp